MQKFPLSVLCVLALLPQVSATEPPRLAVVIIVDQMRADFLPRFGPHFGEGGFRRLLTGADYRNCHYRYALTKTAAGHATILSGMLPETHGIIANEWMDRTTFAWGNAVEDTDSPLVGLPPRANRYANATFAAKAGRSPRNFLGSSVGDWLQARYGAASKVFGVADKDRSAILPVGRKPDGAYWTEEGIFVTSTYYHAELPAWVAQFNARRNGAQHFGQTWDRLREKELYDRVQGPDDAPGEEVSPGLSATLPKKIGGGELPSGDFYGAFDRTPWANELVADMAAHTIETHQLGRDDIPDLLTVGFSQPDSTGHAYGPDSHEVMDTYLRLDRTLAQFFSLLDAKVGAGRWVAVLTADHGIPPLPERVLVERGPGSAGRISGSQLDAHIKSALDAAFGTLPDPLVWALRDNAGYHLQPKALAAKNLPAEQVTVVLADALRRHPQLAAAYTRAQLTAPGPLDEWGEMVRRGYLPARSPDVVFVEKPFFQVRSQGTTHGTPHAYDTHVPLVWYGPGIKPRTHNEKVGVDDLAPTLAGLLGVEPAPEVRGRKLF